MEHIEGIDQVCRIVIFISGSPIRYDRNDGLPSLECPGGFQPAGTTTPDGRLWFPTVAGVVSIAPDLIPENKLSPPVWVEEVLVDGTPEPAVV